MSLYELMKFRRTTRVFSSADIEDEKLQKILQAGIYAPSGSNKSPYRIFVVKNQEVKARIRRESEKVEREFYAKKRRSKMSEGMEFLDWAEQKNIRAIKPFLTEAPVLLSVSEDTRWADRHSRESTWLSIAYMILAAENEGLGTVTYTPEPHDFMREILGLDDHFAPQVILPLGYPKNENKRAPNRPLLSERVIHVR